VNVSRVSEGTHRRPLGIASIVGMPVGPPSLTKSLAQSSIRAASLLLAGKRTELILSAANAYIGAIRGLGWSPSVDQEARCAVACIEPHKQWTVIDAGANVGSWAVAFRQHMAGNGRLYAFEPQPQAAARIRELNIGDCEVVEVALAEHSGRTAFYTSDQTDTMASLYERRDTYVKDRKYRRTEVDVISLDDFVELHKIDSIDFMKMDLEGGELAALKGAARCLQSAVLRALSFEFGISNVNARVFFLDIFSLLTANRYHIYRVTPAGRLVPVLEYSEDHEHFARTTTYLAKVSPPD
jgi:FkbM family methyltransferase